MAIPVLATRQAEARFFAKWVLHTTDLTLTPASLAVLGPEWPGDGRTLFITLFQLMNTFVLSGSVPLMTATMFQVALETASPSAYYLGNIGSATNVTNNALYFYSASGYPKRLPSAAGLRIRHTYIGAASATRVTYMYYVEGFSLPTQYVDAIGPDAPSYTFLTSPTIPNGTITA